MEVQIVNLLITHEEENGSSQVLHTHATPALSGHGCDLSVAEGRRAFMQHTIDGLWKLKEQSDACLTGIIDANKKDGDVLKKQASGEPSKRAKVEEEVKPAATAATEVALEGAQAASSVTGAGDAEMK